MEKGDWQRRRESTCAYVQYSFAVFPQICRVLEAGGTVLYGKGHRETVNSSSEDQPDSTLKGASTERALRHSQSFFVQIDLLEPQRQLQRRNSWGRKAVSGEYTNACSYPTQRQLKRLPL